MIDKEKEILGADSALQPLIPNLSDLSLEVEEVELRKAGEIRIEGNEAAAAGDREGGEVSVRPKAVEKICGLRQGGEGGI